MKPFDHSDLIEHFVNNEGLNRKSDLLHKNPTLTKWTGDFIFFPLEMGTPLNTVHWRAGHAIASTTSDVYGHSMARSQEEAAERIEKMGLPNAITSQSKESYESKPGNYLPEILVSNFLML